jgi:hypothetical protein
MKKIIFTILLITVYYLPAFSQSNITAQEYDFYANYIDRRFIIYRNTLILDSIYLKAAKKQLKGVSNELFNDFVLKNNKSYRIGEGLKGYRFTDEPKPNLDTNKELVIIFDAIAAISRVGFTKGGKQALIFYSESAECCSGCFNAVIWLKLENNKWVTHKFYQRVIC